MKLTTILVTVPAALVLIAVAVANRAPVQVSFDPLAGENPAFALRMPLYLALFAALLLGLCLGGIVAWLAGMSRRMALAKRNRNLARLAAAGKNGTPAA